MGLLHLWSYFPQILTFYAIIDGIAYLTSISNFSLVIYRNNLLLYIDPVSWNLAQLSVLVVFCRCDQIFKKGAAAICKWSQFSFSLWSPGATYACLFPFPCFRRAALAGIPSAPAEEQRGGAWGHVPDLRRVSDARHFRALASAVADAPTKLSQFCSIPGLLRAFLRSGRWILSNAAFYMYWDDFYGFVLFNMLM